MANGCFVGVEGKVTSEDAANLSTIFDVGGIIGGIIAGFSTDRTGKPAMTCVVMLVAAIPAVNQRIFLREY